MTRLIRTCLDAPGGVSGVWHGTLDSTNDEALRLLRSAELPPLSFVGSDEQTAGRGTRGRPWSSPAGAGLYLSIIHYRPPVRAVARDYTLAAGIACAEACQELFGLAVRLKPVNDLVIDRRKLGGILVEGLAVSGRLRGLATGIGINTKDVPRDLFAHAAEPASLEALLPGFCWNVVWRERLASALVARVDCWYTRLFAGSFEQVRSAWEAYCLPGSELKGDENE